MIRSTAATALLAFAWLASTVAAAQDENPESDNPRVAPPSECVAEPRAADQLAGLLALDGNGVAPPAWPIITAPLGQNLTSSEAIPVKEAVREILACFNAGDIPRAAAYMTDNGVLRTYWQLTTSPAARAQAVERLATATPRPERAQIRIVATTDISLLPDGRIAVFVVINDPLGIPAGPETLLFYFQHQDGVWKLDDWVDFSVVPGPSPTPPA